MKKLTKALLMLAVAVTVIFASASIASAETCPYVSMEKPTSTTEINFYVDLRNYTSKYYDAANYALEITGWNITDSEGKALHYGSTLGPELVELTCTEGYTGKAKLTVNYTYTRLSSGYSGNSYDTIYIDINAKPVAMKKSDIAISSIGSSYVSFQAAKPATATGCQVEVTKVGKTKGKKTKFYSYSGNVSISTNVAYKYRVRSYYDNTTTGKTYYGAWSSYKYFMNPTASATKYYSTNTWNVKIKGASKVSKYKIYVSNNRDGKGTLVKTVKPSVGKTVTYSIKTSKSYVKVVPVISGDHTSDTWKILY